MDKIEKIETPDGFEEEVFKLVDENIKFHTAQLFKRTESGYAPEGTSVLLNIGDHYILLSAAHVIDAEGKALDLFIRTGESDFFQIGGHWLQSYKEVKEDIIAMFLPEGLVTILEESGKRFLPISKCGKGEKIQAQQYLIYGYPEKNQKNDHGILKTGGSIFLGSPSSDKAFNHYNLTKSKHHCLSYSFQRNLFKGEKEKSFEPYGVSGSGLWFISVSKLDDVYEYDYSLIGIMHFFSLTGKHQVLIGNTLEVIFKLMESKGLISKSEDAEL